MEAEQIALIALLQNCPKDVSWPSLAARVSARGSAVAVWESDAERLVFDGTSQNGLLEAAQRDLQRWAEEGLTVLTILNETYPAQLREIQQVPPVLFARGQVKVGDRGVSLVGSRKASPRALSFTTKVAELLVEAGLSVISGLAAGVDTAAHTAALASGGRTVAFLGTGIHNYYPAANRELQDTIAAEGQLLSQFWPDGPTQRHNFPMRNAVMSGYGRASIIVEASEKSGTRSQAHLAVAHGRPVILTDRVVASTTWGAALCDRPGVYVVSTPEEALTIVQRISRPLQDQVDDLISAC